MSPCVFVVTDIEADGPDAGLNSMISFASIALNERGEELSHFATNLLPLEDAHSDPGTMDWWDANPTAYNATIIEQRVPEQALLDWVEWMQQWSVRPIFAAHPLSFDGAWMDYYLQRFVGRRLFDRPRCEGISQGNGIDIQSMIMSVTGRSYLQCTRENYPESWLGNNPHDHLALTDALGYANLLRLILHREIY